MIGWITREVEEWGRVGSRAHRLCRFLHSCGLDSYLQQQGQQRSRPRHKQRIGSSCCLGLWALAVRWILSWQGGLPRGLPIA